MQAKGFEVTPKQWHQNGFDLETSHQAGQTHQTLRKAIQYAEKLWSTDDFASITVIDYRKFPQEWPKLAFLKQTAPDSKWRKVFDDSPYNVLEPRFSQSETSYLGYQLDASSFEILGPSYLNAQRAVHADDTVLKVLERISKIRPDCAEILGITDVRFESLVVEAKVARFSIV